MAVLNITVNGLDASIKSIDAAIKNIEKGVQAELNAWAIETSTLAKQYAPTDEGHLKGSIAAEFGQLKASVTVAVDYAAYIEFGTRKFAASYVGTLPQDWQSFAATYKGPAGGGSFEEFVMNIFKWVKRKGIGATNNINPQRRDRVGKQTADQTMEADAYAIALYIIRNGIKSHPYLYPAYQKTKPELIENIKSLLKK